MNFKKFLCFLLLLTTVFAFAACRRDKTAKHTVTFDSNGGTPVASQVVKSGTAAFEPEAPTKEGHIFLGWYRGNNKWDFSKPVTSDMTLVAEWEVDSENCQHVDNNGDKLCDNCGKDFSTTLSITYKDGYRIITGLKPNSYNPSDKDLKLPNGPAKSHYEFIGWYADANFTEVATKIDTSKGTNLTYYAKYEPITYTITYNLNGGENAESNPTSYNVTEVVINFAEPTREGFIFLGWYTDNAFTQPITQINKTNVGNTTLYARWADPKDSFTVTYLDHEGNELTSDTLYKSDNTQTLRSSTEFPVLNVEGYSFLNWVNIATGEAIDCIPAGNTENITLRASLKNEATHNLLFYVDGGFDTARGFLEVEGLDTLYAPEKGGYTFDGWYTNRDYTGDKVTSIAPGTKEDIKLYGRFIALEYTVTFEIDGVITDLGLNTYATSDSDIVLPAVPEKVGHTILGWYTADGKLMEENKIKAGTFGDLELHARYEKVSFKITYHLYGGVNDSRNVTEYRFDEIPTLYDAASKPGYMFGGWFTNPAFNGTPIDDLSAFANQDVSLYAMWIPDTDGDSGTLTPEVPLG